MIWIIFIKILKNTTQTKKRKILNVFDDMIVNMLKLNSIVTELFIGGRKLNIFVAFIMQFYFDIPKV